MSPKINVIFLSLFLVLAAPERPLTADVDFLAKMGVTRVEKGVDAPDFTLPDLQGKKIALFGLGDQKGYPENFLDGVGIMAEILEDRGASLVGFTSVEGYEFIFTKFIR